MVPITKRLMAPEGAPGGSFSGRPPLEGQKRIRVLHIEDDPQVSKATERLLSRKAKAQVVSANGSESALRILETDKNFDAILITVQLRVGLSGVQIFRELPPELKQKVIFLSSGCAASDGLEINESRRPHLDKMSFHELVAKIEEMSPLSPELEGQRQIRVLHVDDTEMVRKGVARFLKNIDASVVSAGSHKSALGILAKDRNFDAIVLDFDMGSENGVELFWKLPEECRGKVVFFSGEKEKKNLKKISETGRPLIDKSKGPELLEEIKKIASGN